MIEYLFTAVGFAHRVFLGKFERKRPFGIRYDMIRYLFTAVGFAHRVFLGKFERKSLFLKLGYDIYLLQLSFHTGCF